MPAIGGLLGRSASGPLEEIALKAQMACELLPDIIDHCISRHLESVNEVYKKLETLESEVDDIKDAIRANLTSSIFSSVKRYGILDVVAMIEEVADRTQSVGRMLTFRDLNIPLPAQSKLRELANACNEAGERMGNTVSAYRVSEKQKFSDSTLEQLYESANEVMRIEDESNQLQDDFQHLLFKNEQSSDPVSVILLMQLTDRLAQVCDACENAVEALMRLASRK